MFVVTTAAFLVSALLVRAARLPTARTVHERGVWEKVLRGPRLFLRTPELHGLMAIDVAVAVATAMVMVNTVVLVQGVFDLERTATAIAFAVFGFGAIAGALTLPWVLPTVPERTVMLGGSVLMALALLGGAVISTLTGLTAVWLLLGLGVSLALTPASYLIRRIARPEDLQTLFAAQFSISNGCLLVAYSVAGLLGAAAGMPVTFLVLGLAAGLATLVAALIWPKAAA
jgi:predicted MFS family arabinose efflux permease